MQPKKKKQKIDETYLASYTTDDFVKTQLDELFSGIKRSIPPDNKQLTDFLLSLKPSKKTTIGEAFNAQKDKKSVWPLPDCFAIPNGTFKFFPPSEVLPVGGMVTSTHLKGSCATDLLLVLPDKFSQPKDYLNARYIVKRTLFLLHIIPKLQKCDFIAAIKFRYLNNDVLKPVLNVKCKSGDCVNLIPAINSSVFKRSLLSSDKNAVRPEKIYKDTSNHDNHTSNHDNYKECLEVDTPYYNSSVLSDVRSPQYFQFLAVIKSSDSLKQALTILKFWCERKNVGVTGHVLTVLLLHLHTSGAISAEMNVLTLVKQMWSFLSTSFVSSVSGGIVIGSQTKQAGHRGMFSDTSANVLYNTPRIALEELARHSEVMLGMLDSREYNTFLSVLTERVSSLFDLYDVVYEIKIPPSFLATTSSDLLPQYSLQYCGVKFLGFIDCMRGILTKAYGDRVKQIKIQHCLQESWSRKKSPTLPVAVKIGLTIDRDNWTRQVERGPSADTVESKEFKEFWGDKSDMRRFQDGSIIQAVVWNGKTAQERRSILTQITEHVLARHAGVASDQISELRFESGDLVGRSYYEGDGEEQAQKIIKTFGELSKILRNCSKIPLSITSVLGVSPVLRNTDLFPQAEYTVCRAKTTASYHDNHKSYHDNHTSYHDNHKSMAFPNPGASAPPYVKAHGMVCHFESSGKWPEDVRGIVRLKAAFYLALKEELESMHITARVNPDFLDIARNGFVFRLQFLVPKEVKIRASNISFWVPCSSEELMLHTEVLPSVTSHLTSLSLQHPAFPLTVRYLKHWVAVHQLSNYIPDMFCELVVAHLFQSNNNKGCHGYRTPQTATTGLLRVLSLFSSFDWNLYPLLVNFNEELSSETLELYDSFMTRRRSYPDACIVCPQNELSELTRNTPTRTSLNILKLLAGKSISQQAGLESIFTPDNSTYNVIIHLKRNQTGRYSSYLATNSSHLATSTTHHAKGSHFPVVEYEPARLYVEELTRAYGYLCLFLYNKYCPTQVGVVMRRSVNSAVKFTVNGSAGKVLSEGCHGNESGLVKDNLDALISDFDLIGKGLVRNVEVVKLDI